MNSPQESATLPPATVPLPAEAGGTDRAAIGGVGAAVSERAEDVAGEATLYASVARLTRGLHEGLRQLGLDARLAQAAGSDMPDACMRLDHVVQMTERAAHRTLDLVDEARAVAEQLGAVSASLERLQTRSGFIKPAELNGSVSAVDDASARLRETLTDLAQAQEYQDLSGQVIRRVISLVRKTESALLDLLRGSLQSAAALPIIPEADELPGPAVPGMQAADQNDADRLLASLGF